MITETNMTAPTLLMLETPREILADVEPVGSGEFQFVHWTEECYPDTTTVSGIQVWERTMFATFEDAQSHDDQYCQLGMYGESDRVSFLDKEGKVIPTTHKKEMACAEVDSSLPALF